VPSWNGTYPIAPTIAAADRSRLGFDPEELLEQLARPRRTVLGQEDRLRLRPWVGVRPASCNRFMASQSKLFQARTAP
jgi:hypothetical protein